MDGPDSFQDLINFLESCAEAGAGAELTPESVELLLSALRHGDPSSGAHVLRFEIVAYDGATEEILGQASSEAIASVIFAEASASEPKRKMVLRSGSSVIKSAP
jgi:hypothetical protein